MSVRCFSSSCGDPDRARPAALVRRSGRRCAASCSSKCELRLVFLLRFGLEERELLVLRDLNWFASASSTIFCSARPCCRSLISPPISLHLQRAAVCGFVAELAESLDDLGQLVDRQRRSRTFAELTEAAVEPANRLRQLRESSADLRDTAERLGGRSAEADSRRLIVVGH